MSQSRQKTRQVLADAPFIPNYLAYLLAHASHLVSGQFHDRLRKRGLAVPTWRVLATLFDSDGMTIGELARVSLTNQPTMTKMIIRLEYDNLVERHSDAADRRKTLVFISPTGWELICDLIGEATDHERQVLESHSDQEIETLKKMLRTLILRLEG